MLFSEGGNRHGGRQAHQQSMTIFAPRGKPRQLDRAPSAEALLTAHSQAALCDDLASSLPLTAIDREALECAPPVRSVSAGCTMVRTRNRP